MFALIKVKNMNCISEQIKWIESGKIGCVFASALVKIHKNIGWHFVVNPAKLEIPDKAFLLSILFPEGDINSVKEWALNNGMFIEDTSDLYEGLRIKMEGGISWVQYFGPDSHVKTRQAPYPMLSFTCKLPKRYYFKVGFNGILHLAHASIHLLSSKAIDVLWRQSVAKTKKELGFSPTIREAAKTTYEK